MADLVVEADALPLINYKRKVYVLSGSANVNKSWGSIYYQDVALNLNPAVPGTVVGAVATANSTSCWVSIQGLTNNKVTLLVMRPTSYSISFTIYLEVFYR